VVEPGVVEHHSAGGFGRTLALSADPGLRAPVFDD
jgi:hypothetical protein